MGVGDHLSFRGEQHMEKMILSQRNPKDHTDFLEPVEYPFYKTIKEERLFNGRWQQISVSGNSMFSSYLASHRSSLYSLKFETDVRHVRW